MISQNSSKITTLVKGFAERIIGRRVDKTLKPFLNLNWYLDKTASKVGFHLAVRKTFIYLRNDRENTDWLTESLLNTGFTSADFNSSRKIDAKIMLLKLAKKKS